MKIVWLCSWYPHLANPFDGDFVQRHARAAAQYDHVTVFYVSQSGLHNQVEERVEKLNEGVVEKIFSFGFTKTGVSLIDKLVYNRRYYRSYKKAIRNHFKEEGLPDVIHVHVPMKAGMIARWIGQKWKIPFIVTEHSAHYAMGTTDDFFQKTALHRRQVSGIFKKAKTVTNVSFFMAARLRSIFLLNDVRIIHNTVNTSLFNYNPSSSPKFRFIHVSTLANHQKNVTGIINAVKRLSERRGDFELVVAGPAGEGLKKYVSALMLDKLVSFTGEIPYNEVALRMQQASALILFSRYENSPCVIGEALCCGLPVISSDVGGVKEIVNSDNGILVSSENEEELMLAMDKLITNYKNYNRVKIAEMAKARFSYEVIGKQLHDLYTEVVKK